MHQSLLMTAFIENGTNWAHLVHNMSRIQYANLQSTYHSGCEKTVYQRVTALLTSSMLTDSHGSATVA